MLLLLLLMDGPASPVLLTKNGPLGAPDSMARLTGAAVPSYLFKSMATVLLSRCINTFCGV